MIDIGKDLEEACRQMFGSAECPLCKKRGKTWEGDDPVCALKNGKFSDDNWNCATMNKLREIAIRLGLTYRDDIGCGSCGVVPFEGEDYSGFIVITWHKERGRTKNAIFLSDDRPIGEIDLKTALDAIQYWEALC